MIPLSVPNFEGNEMKYVTDAISQGWVSTGGAYVKELEEKIADYAHIESSAVCQSGTAALHMALLECGVKRNDFVLSPTLTFIAAINPISYIGAEPIFIDCDDNLCIDPLKILKFCKEECYEKEDILYHKKTNRRVSAVVVVHVFGNIADMEKIMQIAQRYHLKVIEDATEALGTFYLDGKYSGMMAGTIGDMGALSFNGNKIITTGGGGAVLGRDTEKLAHIKYLSTQAKDDAHFYIHNEIGYNYRMTNVQAAIGVGQMECIEEFVNRKNKNYNLYKERIGSNKKIRILDFRNGIRSNKWFYSVLVPTDKISIRDAVGLLLKSGIETRPIWGLIHQQIPYKKAISYEIEKAYYYAGHIINVPSSTNLTEAEIEKVVECLNRIYE